MVKSGFEGRWVFKISPKSGGSGKVILFLHGGGGMMCPTFLHYRMFADLVKNTDATMYLPFYPLAPESNVLETIAWLEKFYKSVLKKHKAQDITFIGDSAGGFLAARLCSLTEDKPNGVIMISPATGFDKKDGKTREAEERDIILSQKILDMIKKYWSVGVPSDSPDINAEYIDYSGFPPVMLWYGTNEMFSAYMCNLIDNIRKCGVELEVHEGDGLCHDWAIVNLIPEGRRAIRRMSEFVKERAVL